MRVCPKCKGEKWKRISDGAEIKIMAIESNWIMARKPGCVPFTVYLNDFLKTYKKINQDD